MRFNIPAETANSIDQEAIAFVGRLVVEPAVSKDVQGTFRPNYLRSDASISQYQSPVGTSAPIIGPDGNELGRFFRDLDPPVGLFEGSHEAFITLCRKLLEAGQLGDNISHTFLIDRCFHW